MKILIAITSCHAHRMLQQAQRETWIADIPTGVDYRFFLGAPLVIAARDEIILDVPDDYFGLIYKTCGLARWALECGYDFLFKCDIDTLVNPQQLIASDFANYDYVGGLNYPFASGGSGYWLSQKAMQIIARQSPEIGPEDVFVAKILGNKQIVLHNEPDRYLFYPGSEIGLKTITFHISSCVGEPYQADQMRIYYRQMKQIQKNKRLSLTFDDGPNSTCTRALLRILKRHGVLATFFLIGAKVACDPETAKAVADAGHVIANHTFTHPNLCTLGFTSVVAEITRCADALSSSSREYLRPPGGDYNEDTVRAAQELGMKLVMWDIDGFDWKLRTSAEIEKCIDSQIEDGGIVLLHDGDSSAEDGDRWATVHAVDKLIPRYQAEGFEFVLLPEMLLPGAPRKVAL